MKKINNILMAAAILLGTLTSCQDVPMPYNNPLDYQKPKPDEVVIEPAGNGTKESPYNVAGALQFLNTLEADVESDKDIYITGVVTSITESFSTQYGNATFVISDTDEGTNKFTFYRGLYLGNTKYSNANDVNIQEDDVVVICGRIVNYRGSMPETVQNKAYVVSINGKTVEPKPTPTGGDVKAVSIADFNAAEESNDVWYQLTGKVTNLKEGDLYGNFDLVDDTGSVYVYGVLSEKGGEKKKFQDLVTAKGIMEGSTLTIIGNRGSYNGKIEVMNAYFVSVSN